MIWVHDDELHVIKSRSLENALSVIDTWEESGIKENHCLATGAREILRILELSGGGNYEATKTT